MSDFDHSAAVASTANSTEPRAADISGSKLIIGIFAVALVMGGIVWVYWYLHTKPFQPLQIAIAQAFPKSSPRVQGGQRKMHRDTPKILRVTLQVKFDPEQAEAQTQVNDIVARLAVIARHNIDFGNYEIFEVHLVQMRPEQEARKKTVEHKIADLPPPTVSP